jgi:predicted nuclease of predicted toxin-antitoxin system
MILFLTDENFNIHILNGVRRRLPSLDILRIQDAGLRTLSDPLVLEYAAAENRIVLTHDVRTMETHALARLKAGKPMPGLLLIHQRFPIGLAIDEIVLIAECSRDDEWNGLIRYLPL